MLVTLPWFVPMIHGFMTLASLSIAFLSFGRYRVLQEPAFFWIGIAFIGFTVFALFYVLTLPELLPGGRGLIGQLLNTGSWFWHLQFTTLASFIIVAALASWPRNQAAGKWLRFLLVVAGVVITVVISLLMVYYEQYLPLLVVNGTWTLLNNAWNYFISILFVAGIVLSTRRYLQNSDPMFAYLALVQLFLTFAILTVNIGVEYYDTWWYWQRVLWIAGFSVMVFGLLSEYIELYQRERDKSRQLEALQQITDPTIARLGLEELLQSLLERMVAIMGASAGAILLLDPERQELVLRKGLGLTAEQAVGFRVRWGEGLAGRVAARNTVISVRDAQLEPSIRSQHIISTHVRGVIGAPMRVEQEVIGVVQVDFHTPVEFTREDEQLLEVVADRAALAIHQERLLEEAEEERNRLRAVIDTAPVGIAFYSAPDGRLLLLNKSAEAILGQRPRPDMDVVEQADFFRVSRPNGERFPPEDLPAVRSLHGESTQGVELVAHQPSGLKVYLTMNSSPILDADERIIGVVVAFQDITQIKEQERLRDEFLATASHELKTPVTTIKGYIQLMQQWAHGGHDPREARAFEVINVQANRISQRVQEMLEVARYQIAPPMLHKKRFDLGELVSQVVEQMQATTEIHQIHLQREENAPVNADRDRIEDVLVGLLDNSIRYSPEGGDIVVRVWVEDQKAVVSVKDQGVGIPKNRQAHIFEPFYEPIPPGAPGYRGVAPLSLYLSKITIERHGGRIWFESEEGKGSTFYFSLPTA
ncbi:MAG: ATP-binding protein [Chloroflexota bacterium]